MKPVMRLIILLIAVLLMPFCKKKGTAKSECNASYTYESEVKTIISNNCSGSSCHSSGTSNAAFTTYSELKPYLDNGRFKSEVVDRQTMPKGSSLSQTHLDVIRCWVQVGYPEK